MKRQYFLPLFLLIIFLSACAAQPLSQSERPGGSPTVVAGPTGETEEQQTDPANLPTLPALNGASGLGGGFGGGGGGDETASASDMRLWLNPLADAELLLSIGLPAEPVSGLVYQTPSGNIYTLADAARIAAMFGINSPVYTQSYYMEEGNEWTAPEIYQLFDGPRQMSIGPTYYSYYDESIGLDMGVNPMPFAQSGPIAEAFLQERGLLDFPYQMFSYNGFDVEFRRLVDGRLVIFPEFQVSISSDGQVFSVFNNPLGQLSAVGDYPIRSAETAWQLVQEQGVDFSEIFFSSYPGSDYVMPAMPVDNGDYRYWIREYQDGEQVIMYPYPSVHLAVNGDAAPRIIVERFLLSGPADQLEAIAEYTGRQIFLTGTMRNTAQGQVVELVSWNPVEPAVDYTFREGTVRQNGRRTELVVSETESYILPQAPADLQDGERIYVSGWLDGTVGSEPTFNWQSMGIVFAEPTDIVEIDPVEEQAPYQIKQVTIDQVDLVYTAIPVYDEATSQLSYTLQLVWRFRGTADTNEIIEIFVQAVESSFIAPAPLGLG
jgi:hypothetical protein